MPGRIIAIGVMLFSASILAWYHRADLLPSPEADQPDNPALEACLTQRLGEIDTMVADGLITPEQAGPFKTRAQAFCHETTAAPPSE